MEKLVFCRKCNVNKEENLFNNTEKRTGHLWCKLCVFDYNKKYRDKNKEQIRKSKKEYAEKNKEYLREKNKNYYINNKDKILQKDKEYKLKNKERYNKYKKEYRILNKERLCNESKEYYKLNKEKCNNRYKDYYKNNQKYKLTVLIVNFIKFCFKGTRNRSKYFKYLPFTIDELKIHLESLFEPWMWWDNWGVYKINEWEDDNPLSWKWNIDHIIPISKLPFKSMEDENFKKCWSLDNLRPYSAKQNILDKNNR